MARATAAKQIMLAANVRRGEIVGMMFGVWRGVRCWSQVVESGTSTLLQACASTRPHDLGWNDGACVATKHTDGCFDLLVITGECTGATLRREGSGTRGGPRENVLHWRTRTT